MEHITIEALLLSDAGLIQIGQLMAAENMKDDVMQQLSLLDVSSDMISKIENAYQDKLNDMGVLDIDATKMVVEADSDIVAVIDASCTATVEAEGPSFSI